MRRELGGQLAARRKAAGYAQREFGTLTGYSRTAIANAELGAHASRQLWEQADRVLRTGELFARGYDRIQSHIATGARAEAERLAPPALPEGPGPVPPGVQSLSAAAGRQAYLDHGWPAEQDRDGRLWLATGAVIDALEVPRAAGLVAVGWWLYTRGVPDEIRGLPALPDPASALAVIAGESACYFLTRPGSCPWDRQDRRPDTAGSADVMVVRWHAEGGRVPAPPSQLDGGGRATWAHAPSVGGQLVSPMALLHVLAQATAATRDGLGLALPGGVRAVPASMAPPVEWGT
jgi:transcriptional regulator with XRE-family HTH domain